MKNSAGLSTKLNCFLNIYKISVLLLCAYFSIPSYAQFNTQFQLPKSPESYLFEKYGNMPISNYTGKPNVSIPLYNIEYGDISIPLSLSYTSNGIRVDEEASSVGLGWYLGTGMISQVINGKDDLRKDAKVQLPDYFYSGTPAYVIAPQPRWFFDTYPPGQKDVRSPARIEMGVSNPESMDKFFIARVRSDGSYSNMTWFSYKSQMTDYSPALNYSFMDMDIEMDLFRVNFFGHDLIFYITPDTNKSICILNNENYSIKLITNVVNNINIYTWLIKTPDGLSYYFEEEIKTVYASSAPHHTTTLDNTDTGYKTYDPNIVPSNITTLNPFSRIWKVTKIKDTKGNEVNFKYSKLQDIVSQSSRSGKCDYVNITSYYTGTEDLFAYYYDGPDFSNGNGWYPQTYPLGKGIYYFNNSISIMRQEKSVLSEIDFGDSKVVFTNTDRLDIPYDKKISGISVKYKNRLIKDVNLTYDYFNNFSQDDTQKRLKLKEVSFAENSYKLVYNETLLPNKNSNSFDYWGYYNGMPNTSTVSNPFRLYQNSSLIPLWAKDLIPLVEGKANRSAHPEYCKAGMLEKIVYPTGGYTQIAYELNEFDNYFFPNFDNKTGVDANNNYINNYSQAFSKGYGLRVKEITDFTNEGTFYKKKYHYKGGKHIPPFIGYLDENHYTKYNVNSVNGGVPVSSKTTSSGSKITSYHSSIYQTNFLSNGENVGYDSVTIEEEGSNLEKRGKIEYFYTNTPDVSARDRFGFTTQKSWYDYFGYSIRGSDTDNGSLLKEIVYDKNNGKVRESKYDYYSVIPKPYNTTYYNVKAVGMPGVYGYAINPNDGVSTSYTLPPINEVYKEYLFFYYPLKTTNTRLKSKIDTDYFSSGGITTTTNYTYDSAFKVKSIEVKNSEGLSKKEIIDYYITYDLSYRNQFNLPAFKEFHENGAIKERHVYRYVEANGVANLSALELHPQANPIPYNIKKSYYDMYDDKNNLIEFHNEEDIYTCIIWGYDKTLPIAKIVGERYSNIASSVLNLQNISNSDNDNCMLTTCNEEKLREALNNLRNNFGNSFITTYTYDPLVGITSTTDPRGYVTYYVYDQFNRLKYIKDSEGKVLKENEYHFATQN